MCGRERQARCSASALGCLHDPHLEQDDHSGVVEDALAEHEAVEQGRHPHCLEDGQRRHRVRGWWRHGERLWSQSRGYSQQHVSAQHMSLAAGGWTSAGRALTADEGAVHETSHEGQRADAVAADPAEQDQSVPASGEQRARAVKRHIGKRAPVRRGLQPSPHVPSPNTTADTRVPRRANTMMAVKLAKKSFFFKLRGARGACHRAGRPQPAL